MEIMCHLDIFFVSDASLYSMIIYLSVGDPWSDKKSYESINLLTDRVVTLEIVV
jgi:hypothetical protein